MASRRPWTLSSSPSEHSPTARTEPRWKVSVTHQLWFIHALLQISPSFSLRLSGIYRLFGEMWRDTLDKFCRGDNADTCSQPSGRVEDLSGVSVFREIVNVTAYFSCFNISNGPLCSHVWTASPWWVILTSVPKGLEFNSRTSPFVMSPHEHSHLLCV